MSKFLGIPDEVIRDTAILMELDRRGLRLIPLAVEGYRTVGICIPVHSPDLGRDILHPLAAILRDDMILHDLRPEKPLLLDRGAIKVIPEDKNLQEIIEKALRNPYRELL